MMKWPWEYIQTFHFFLTLRAKYTTQKKIYSVHEDNLFAIQFFFKMTLFIEKNLTFY